MNSWKQIQAAKAVLSRETGTVYKDPGGKLTIALAYPNRYYVGMSSLALQILYRAFNARPDVACERVFWHEDEARAGLPLVSLESQTDAGAFDVWAFTISFEMDYFNVVAMLEQAGVPPLAADRTAAKEMDGRPSWPLLIAGGPGITMNPEPMAPFFDAMVIGEAEEMLDGLVDVLADGVAGERERLLDALDALPGVYVPQRCEPAAAGRRIQRLWVHDFEAIEPISSLATPDTEFAGMRLLELARGCGRGCRYCLAGYVYRPPREQPMARILAWARETMAAGPDGTNRPPGVGLVAAAVSDHSQIDEIATELRAMGARISVSSMRTDPISVPLVEAMAASGTQTLTIAPEAGTERLRRAINKPQSEGDLLAAVELAQALKFPQLKMYFMIGHPTETAEDIQGIVDLALSAKRVFKRNISINATPFVPKAHTPFQAVAMTPARLLQDRQNQLKRALARHQVAVHSDSPAWAEVQGVLARGDRRLAPVLLELAEPSVRGFHEALARHGLSAAEYLAARDPGGCMPWQIVEGGVKPAYLLRELRLAEQSQAGFHCPPQPARCQVCGVCSQARTGAGALTGSEQEQHEPSSA